MDVDPADLEPPVEGVDEWLAAWEDRLAADMAGMVRALLAPALEAWAATALVAAGDPSPLDTLETEWATLVVNEYGDVIGGLHQAGALSAWVGSGVSEALADSWLPVVNEAAVEYQAKATNRIVGSSDAMWRKVRARTVNAVQTGMTNEQLKDEIEHVMQVSEQRADAIARTETIAAYNGGNFAGAQALGSYGPAEKTWSAADDARTRPTHADADGQTVPFDAPFIVGGVSMAHPHDPTAPAREVVHCRCRALFLYPGDTRPDGSIVGGDQASENIPDDVTPGVPERGVPDAGFDTWDEARTYLQARHPGVTWDGVDMAKWDRRAVRDVAVWADDVGERFPDHWGTVRYIGSRTTRFPLSGGKVIDRYDWSVGEMAHADMWGAANAQGGFVAVNPVMATDWDAWSGLARMSGETGWIVGRTPIDTLYHEFGHIIHGSTHRLATAGGPTPPWAMITGDMNAPGDMTIFSTFDQWFWREVKGKAQAAGSKYGSSNLVEAAAETLTTVITDTATGASLRRYGEAWLEVADLFRSGVIGFDQPAEYVVNIDRVLAAHNIRVRPDWPTGLTVDDAQKWLDTGKRPRTRR